MISLFENVPTTNVTYLSVSYILKCFDMSRKNQWVKFVKNVRMFTLQNSVQ